MRIEVGSEVTVIREGKPAERGTVTAEDVSEGQRVLAVDWGDGLEDWIEERKFARVGGTVTVPADA